MLTYAKKWYADNPTEFVRAREIMAKAQAAGSGSLVEIQAEEAIEQLDADYQSYAMDQWMPLSAQVDTMLENQNYDEALAVHATFDPVLSALIADTYGAAEVAIINAAVQAITKQISATETALAAKRP